MESIRRPALFLDRPMAWNVGGQSIRGPEMRRLIRRIESDAGAFFKSQSGAAKVEAGPSLKVSFSPWLHDLQRPNKKNRPTSGGLLEMRKALGLAA